MIRVRRNYKYNYKQYAVLTVKESQTVVVHLSDYIYIYRYIADGVQDDTYTHSDNITVY